MSYVLATRPAHQYKNGRIHRFERFWYDEEDPVLSYENGRVDHYAAFRDRELNIRHKYGNRTYTETMALGLYDDETDLDEEIEAPEDREFDPNGNYTNGELSEWADVFLKEDAARELCRICRDDGAELPYGEETGHIESRPAMKDGQPILDEDGNQRWVDFPELACPEGHKWFRGEGPRRDIRGKDPILFEAHLKNRQRREIYNTMGIPEPNIVSGMYNRVHKDGRRVNTDEQRKRNGASFYR